MPRHERLAEPDALDQLGHRRFALGEPLDDPQTIHVGERLVHDAQGAEVARLKTLPEAEREKAKLDLHTPAYAVPKRDAALTPNFTKTTAADGTVTLHINLPNCVFPAYRADGKPSHVTTLMPDHPIAKGLPVNWDVGHTEMYDEPFHVPAPDAVIFEEKWDAGEHFRSGSLWNIGEGKVFYFRPGHETFPVYKEEYPLRVIENAARWLGEQVKK